MMTAVMTPKLRKREKKRARGAKCQYSVAVVPRRQHAHLPGPSPPGLFFSPLQPQPSRRRCPSPLRV